MTLTTHHLTRRYGSRLAVDDVSFEVERGRLTGFVGANGAGKTTVMRMILGVLSPTSGSVTLDGVELDQKTRRSFGYMPEERGLYPKMPLREQMIYFARLHGLSPTQAATNSDALLETLNLASRASDPIENLSLGNQQRAQVAVSLVHQPTALILDEPFSGLDPMAVDTILSVLAQHAARGIPVLLSSHQLDLIERLCDDLVIISDGKLVAAGSIEELRKEFNRGQHQLSAQTDLRWLAEWAGQHHPSIMKSLNVTGDGAHGSTLSFQVDEDSAQSDEALRQLLVEALSVGPIKSFGPVSAPLSEIFREVVEDRDPVTEEAA